jgi:hypothetical protein
MSPFGLVLGGGVPAGRTAIVPRFSKTDMDFPFWMKNRVGGCSGLL